MKQEKYQPTPEELAEAHSRMTPEQKELSAIREIFIESEHRIVELPPDLNYKVEGHQYTTGRLSGKISGTFDGRKIELEKSSWDNKEFHFMGKMDGTEISNQEAEKLYNQVYPAVVAFDKMQSTQRDAISQLRGEGATVAKQQKEKVDLAREQGLEEGEQIGKIKGILEKRLEGIEANEEDREFLKGVIELISQLYAQKTQLESERDISSIVGNFVSIQKKLEIPSFDPEETEKGKKNAKYNRRAELLMALLGVKEPQKWVAGFGVKYVHSLVYETTLPDTILRECYEHRELSNGVSAEMTVERNSRYQKKEKEIVEK